jgi:hypothetical protein
MRVLAAAAVLSCIVSIAHVQAQGTETAPVVGEDVVSVLQPVPAPGPSPKPDSLDALASQPGGAQPGRLAALLTARPLFSPTRRPMAEDLPRLSGADLPRLSGTVVARGKRQAIFAAEAPGKPIVVSEGDKISGLTVQSIVASEVVLQDGGRRLALQPRQARFAPGPAPRGLDILNGVLLPGPP